MVPGARVAFRDNVYAQGSSTPTSRTVEQGDRYQTRTLDDGNSHEVLKNYWTRAELAAAVEGLTTDVPIEFW